MTRKRKKSISVSGQVMKYDPNAVRNILRTEQEQKREAPNCPLCKDKENIVWEGNTPVCWKTSCILERLRRRTQFLRDQEISDEKVVHFARSL